MSNLFIRNWNWTSNRHVTNWSIVCTIYFVYVYIQLYLFVYADMFLIDIFTHLIFVFIFIFLSLFSTVCCECLVHLECVDRCMKSRSMEKRCVVCRKQVRKMETETFKIYVDEYIDMNNIKFFILIWLIYFILYIWVNIFSLCY
jgi:hypothetical protein